MPSWLSPQASRVPGYEPDPQAPHPRSASGSSRETPLIEQDAFPDTFYLFFVNNFYFSGPRDADRSLERKAKEFTAA